MNRGSSSSIDPTAFPHVRMILIGTDGVLAEQGDGARAHALLTADLEQINRELRPHGMHTEPAGHVPAGTGSLSCSALAALSALPTVRLVVAVADDDSARGYLAILADTELRAIERDQRLISALTG